MITKNQKEQLRKIAKIYKVNPVFRKMKKAGGWSRGKYNLTLDPTFRRDYVFSLFFHELSHCICSQCNIYDGYHKNLMRNKKEKNLKLRLALRAELYVDNCAKQLMKFYLPNIKHIPCYSRKKDRDWMLNYWRKVKI